jgi:hypothetical protein
MVWARREEATLGKRDGVFVSAPEERDVVLEAALAFICQPLNGSSMEFGSDLFEGQLKKPNARGHVSFGVVSGGSENATKVLVCDRYQAGMDRKVGPLLARNWAELNTIGKEL